MAKKLDSNDLNNVNGGGCNDSGKCDECGKKLQNDTYWTCTFTEDIIGQKSQTKEFKLCNTCAAKAKADKRYSNWQQHLAK